MPLHSAGLSIICSAVLPKLLTLSIKDVDVLTHSSIGEPTRDGQKIAKNFTSLKNLELFNTNILYSAERKELAKSCNVSFNGVKL
jgi:hypothetical protein